MCVDPLRLWDWRQPDLRLQLPADFSSLFFFTAPLYYTIPLTLFLLYPLQVSALWLRHTASQASHTQIQKKDLLLTEC